MKEHLVLLRGRCALQEFDRIGPENGGTAMKDIVRMGEGIEEVREVIPGSSLQLHYTFDWGQGLLGTLRIVAIDTTGLKNPGTTLYALQDSITGKYVRPYAGALDSMVSGTYDSSWVWQTFSQWGGANGDTIYFPAGSRSAFRIYSKNSQ
mgnify:CR=1 FL=1